MKKFLVILFFFAFHNYICTAQNKTVSDSNRIEKLKIEYLTKKLELSPSESQTFWPVYETYIKEIRGEWKKCNCESNPPAFREKAAAIKDKYRPAFTKILHSHDRANDVYRVEKEYREMLKKTLHDRGKN